MGVPEKKSEGGQARHNIPALREIIEERKVKAIDSLSTSYAKNRLPLEEYERLVEYINKIESERELAVVEKIVAEHAGVDSAERPAAHEEDDYVYQRHGNDYEVNSSLTVLSSRVFDGPLKSGSQYVTVLGSGQIRVRKADLSKKRTVLHLFTVLGDSVISVEPGIRVINKVIPLLADTKVSKNISGTASGGEPELVIKGVAFLGDITIKQMKD